MSVSNSLCTTPTYAARSSKASLHSATAFSFQHQTTTTILRPFFRDHPGEPVPEENFWTLWCKGRLTEADTPTIWLGATPSGLTSAHLHHPTIFFTGRMPFLPPNQQCQSTDGNTTLENCICYFTAYKPVSLQVWRTMPLYGTGKHQTTNDKFLISTMTVVLSK